MRKECMICAAWTDRSLHEMRGCYYGTCPALKRDRKKADDAVGLIIKKQNQSSAARS